MNVSPYPEPLANDRLHQGPVPQRPASSAALPDTESGWPMARTWLADRASGRSTSSVVPLALFPCALPGLKANKTREAQMAIHLCPPMGMLGPKLMPDCSAMSYYCGSVSIISPKLGNPHQPWGECGWCHRIAGLPRHDYLVQPTRTMHTIPSPGMRRNLIRTRLPTRLRRIARCFWHVAIDSGRHGPSVRQTQTLTHTLSSSMDPWAFAYRPMWT